LKVIEILSVLLALPASSSEGSVQRLGVCENCTMPGEWSVVTVFCILCIVLYCCVVQFFSDADDVDTWMLDMLRLVSSEDVGHDEASVQSLVKKHKV